MSKHKDYDVGYGKPPKSGQFKPGQSGNPKGRPPRRSTDVMEAFENVFLTREKVKIGDHEGYYAGIDLVFMKMKERAVKSNNAADRKIFIEMLVKMGLQDRFDDLWDDILPEAEEEYDGEESDE